MYICMYVCMNVCVSYKTYPPGHCHNSLMYLKKKKKKKIKKQKPTKSKRNIKIFEQALQY